MKLIIYTYTILMLSVGSPIYAQHGNWKIIQGESVIFDNSRKIFCETRYLGVCEYMFVLSHKFNYYDFAGPLLTFMPDRILTADNKVLFDYKKDKKRTRMSDTIFRTSDLVTVTVDDRVIFNHNKKSLGGDYGIIATYDKLKIIQGEKVLFDSSKSIFYLPEYASKEEQEQDPEHEQEQEQEQVETKEVQNDYYGYSYLPYFVTGATLLVSLFYIKNAPSITKDPMLLKDLLGRSMKGGIPLAAVTWGCTNLYKYLKNNFYKNEKKASSEIVDDTSIRPDKPSEKLSSEKFSYYQVKCILAHIYNEDHIMLDRKINEAIFKTLAEEMGIETSNLREYIKELDKKWPLRLVDQNTTVFVTYDELKMLLQNHMEWRKFAKLHGMDEKKGE